MKRFYIFLLLLPLGFLAALYLPVWWSIGMVVAVLCFIAYRYYADRLEDAIEENKLLETDIEDLNVRLEQSFLKEQKTSKEVGQVKKSKQQLLSVLSHEIRTPMNGVMGMTLLLADTSLTKEQQEYVDTIHRCSENLLNTVNTLLVNDILDFSKLQEEMGQLEYKAFELRDCIEEVLELFAEKVNQSGINLFYDIAADVPVQIIGDSKRLKQVIMNLVENAVKFTQKGEIFIKVESLAHELRGNPPYLCISVQDTGIGITESQLKQLFKGLPGKESSRQPEKAEPGFGLVISKKLVELMGGAITVVSKQGLGSTFTFQIPMTPGLKPTYQQAHEVNLANLNNKRVLLIESNANLNHILDRQLKEWNMVPFPADTIDKAMSLIGQEKEFDLVITELDIPGANWQEIISLLRKRNPNLAVIGLNRMNRQTLEVQTLFPSIINKPVRQRILKDKISAAFTTAVLTDDTLPAQFAEQYPLNILVAEDNQVNQRIALKMLEKLGYKASLAENGQEALEMVGLDQYDVILMDVEMPEMNGLEATRMIRTCLPVQPVIIALTANAMQGDRDECMQAGMDDYISKPIEWDALVNCLEKWGSQIKGRRSKAS